MLRIFYFAGADEGRGGSRADSEMQEPPDQVPHAGGFRYIPPGTDRMPVAVLESSLAAVSPSLTSRCGAFVHAFRFDRVGQAVSAQDGFRDESTKQRVWTVLLAQESRTVHRCPFESCPADRILEIPIRLPSGTARTVGGEETDRQVDNDCTRRSRSRGDNARLIPENVP